MIARTSAGVEAQEFDDLLTRSALFIGFIASASPGAVTLFAHRSAPPGRDSGQILDRVAAILYGVLHRGGLPVNDIRTVSSGYFTDSHDCSVEVTQTSVYVNASCVRWREIPYGILDRDESRRAVVTFEVLGDAPLAGPPPFLWTSVLAYRWISAI
jgi:hypothetical protein